MIDFIMMLALLPSFFLSLDAVVASVQPRSSMPSRGHQPRIPSWSTKFIASEATDAYTRCLRQNPQSPQFRVYQNVYFQQGRVSRQLSRQLLVVQEHHPMQPKSAPLILCSCSTMQSCQQMNKMIQAWRMDFHPTMQSSGFPSARSPTSHSISELQESRETH